MVANINAIIWLHKFFYEIFFAGMKNAGKFEVVERSQSHDRQRSRPGDLADF